MNARTHLIALVAALILLIPCVAQAQLTASGTRLLWDGKPVFLRGAYYVQPAAYHHCFLTELDEKQLAPDFKAMRAAGLNCFCISVNWGDFIHSMDVAKGTFEWDRAVEKRFVRLLEAARRENMIVDLWFGTALDPVGVPGMATGKPEKDFCGHPHKPAQGYLWPNYPGCAQFDDFEWRAFVAYHRRVAELTRGFDNVTFDPLDWQHISMNYWEWGNPRNLEAWRVWLKTHNPDLGYWNQRWGEDNKTWDTVLFPVDDWVLQSAARLEGSPYKGKPVTPEGAKTKDFREWHDGVFNFIARTLTGTLKGVRPDVLVGQRVDIWHYGDFRQNTWVVGLVDFYFQGGYSEKPEDARDPGPFIEREVRAVTDRWPRPMPIVFWETGMNIHDLPAAELDELQALQIVATDKKIKALDLSGWMWWTWRGYCMGKAALNFGIVRADGTPRPALLALTRETHEQ
jgi:hypothetical protein